jgi:hypothetical protein
MTGATANEYDGRGVDAAVVAGLLDQLTPIRCNARSGE